MVRDTNGRSGHVLWFSPGAWRTFTAGSSVMTGGVICSGEIAAARRGLPKARARRGARRTRRRAAAPLDLRTAQFGSGDRRAQLRMPGRRTRSAARPLRDYLHTRLAAQPAPAAGGNLTPTDVAKLYNFPGGPGVDRGRPGAGGPPRGCRRRRACAAGEGAAL